ncbi:MAG: Ig-like domain-containing protein, partial [Methanosarcinales archaeon]
NKTMEMKIAQSIVLKASTFSGQVTLLNFTDLTPNITQIISTGLTANNSTIEVNYTTSNNTSSVEFQMFAPPASNVDLHVYDENGNHVGYDQLIGNTTLGFPASYTGKDSNPEITIIPSATNKTYLVKAVLTKSNSNMPTYITVHALETPFRPAVLAVTPNEIIQPTASNQNVSFTVIIGEAGHQHPLENVTVAISNITNANITIPVITQSKHDFGTIPAGTRETVTYTSFVPAGTPFGNYTGLITINSSNAGMQILNVTIPVIAHPNATVLIYTNKSKIEIGENTTITATVLDENGTAIIGTPVEFTLSNNSIGLLNATSLTTDSNGTASVVFTGVAEGITNITASEPAGNSSTLNITVIDTTPPVVISASANPDTIIADGIDTTLLNVTAKDASGIASVTINLSAIGGSEKQLMHNNSGIWQYTVNTTVVGNFQLQVNVTDNAGNFNNSVSIALNATAPKLSLSIYTDKNSYKAGDTMNVTVHIANSGETLDVRANIWIELPNGNSKTFIYKKVKLPTGLDVNITILSFELPPIPNGTYTWHFQLLNQSTGEIIAEDSTEWKFVGSTSTDYHYLFPIKLQLPSLERVASV